MSNLFLRTVALVDTASYPMFSGEAWAQAGKTTLLGMVAVFSVLTIIMLVVTIMGKIFGKKEEAPVTAPVTPVPADLPVASDNEDEQIAAAIIAAISAYRANEEGVSGGFRVVSFRKANTKSSWTNK